jgi:demethylmenaquinone methyltransferase/2-methoxy-6-polyprenyl-1,4-benzoquinol methylase
VEADSCHQPDDDSSERLLASQRAYYDLRAPDYGELSSPSDRRIRGMIPIELARSVVHDAALDGDVVELACGPGMFTAELARRARSVTAVDASPRMLERNRREVRAPNVTYVEADLFRWEPDRVYDAVFFGFWLSHVPTVRFDQFWALVATCIGGDGRVVFVDEDDRASFSDETKVVDDTPAASRRLSDGRSFDIVKLYWAPDDLERHLRDLGWDTHVRPVGATFLYGIGRPPRRPPRR